MALYTVTSIKPIPCLDGIVGPLNEPTKMDKADVLAMVKKGYKVYQHNPSKLSEKVLVTKYNINNITFKTGRSEAVLQKKENIKKQEKLNFTNSKAAEVIKTIASKENVNTNQKKEENSKKDDNYNKKNDNQNNQKKEENKKDDSSKIIMPDNFTK